MTVFPLEVHTVTNQFNLIAQRATTTFMLNSPCDLLLVSTVSAIWWRRWQTFSWISGFSGQWKQIVTQYVKTIKKMDWQGTHKTCYCIQTTYLHQVESKKTYGQYIVSMSLSTIVKKEISHTCKHKLSKCVNTSYAFNFRYFLQLQIIIKMHIKFLKSTSIVLSASWHY